MSDVPEAFEKRISLVTKDSVEGMATLSKYVIQTPEQFEAAAKTKAAMKAELDAIDAERDALVRPKNEWVRVVNAKAKPATDFLKAGIALLASSMSQYTIREEQKQHKLLEEVQAKAAAGDVAGANVAIAKLEAPTPTVAGLSKPRDHWVVVSVDQSKLPAHLLMPDMEKINALVKASKTENPCPGVVARLEKVFTQRKVG